MVIHEDDCRSDNGIGMTQEELTRNLVSPDLVQFPRPHLTPSACDRELWRSLGPQNSWRKPKLARIPLVVAISSVHLVSASTAGAHNFEIPMMHRAHGETTASWWQTESMSHRFRLPHRLTCSPGNTSSAHLLTRTSSPCIPIHEGTPSRVELRSRWSLSLMRWSTQTTRRSSS